VKGKAKLHRTEKQSYDRIEVAYRDFCAAFILAEKEEINSMVYLKAFWELKLWCVETPEDNAVKHLKFLLKVAQAVFLKAEMPEYDTRGPLIYDKIPSLQWIAKAFHYGKRDYPITIGQAQLLTQLANFLRAGPYPSHEMVDEDLGRTIDMVQEEKVLEPKALRSHYGGLRQIRERLNEPDKTGVHISLAGSGCLENPRSKGGKAAYLVTLAKNLTDREIGSAAELGSVCGLEDVFSQMVLNFEVARLASDVLSKGGKLLWGDVLYVPPQVFAFNLANEKPREVPYGLAPLILLVCTEDLRKVGHYDKPIIPNLLGVPMFKPGLKVQFEPDVDSLPVKASVSIEGAGKSRLVTSTMASFTEVGELMNSFMRNWLSKDPFCRIGFEEADKLWEVLRSYDRYKNQKKQRS